MEDTRGPLQHLSTPLLIENVRDTLGDLETEKENTNNFTLTAASSSQRFAVELSVTATPTSKTGAKPMLMVNNDVDLHRHFEHSSSALHHLHEQEEAEHSQHSTEGSSSGGD